MFIELKNVNKVLSGRQLLSNVNCEIEAGQIAVFEGINGSGKTLILKTILGLMKVDGEVLVAGKQVKPQDAYPVKAGILIENPSLITEFTATQNMELELYQRKAVGTAPADSENRLLKLRSCPTPL